MNIDIDRIRIEAKKLLDPARKSIFGQFMTPSAVAQFMASLFNNWDLPKIKLLDPGAPDGHPKSPSYGHLKIPHLASLDNR